MTALGAHHDHDDILKARGAAADADTLPAANTNAERFYRKAREAMTHSRPLLAP